MLLYVNYILIGLFSLYFLELVVEVVVLLFDLLRGGLRNVLLAHFVSELGFDLVHHFISVCDGPFFCEVVFDGFVHHPSFDRHRVVGRLKGRHLLVHNVERHLVCGFVEERRESGEMVHELRLHIILRLGFCSCFPLSR